MEAKEGATNKKRRKKESKGRRARERWKQAPAIAGRRICGMHKKTKRQFAGSRGQQLNY